MQRVSVMLSLNKAAVAVFKLPHLLTHGHPVFSGQHKSCSSSLCHFFSLQLLVLSLDFVTLFVWTESSWLRIGTGGGHLRLR
jgi:hypothetical protein